MIVFNVLWAIVGVILGGYVLFAGRKAVSVTLGIVSLIVAANLLSVLVVGGDRGRDLFELQAWWALGVALLIGVLGLVLGRARPDLAGQLIGFIAGADLALWLYAISAYLIVTLAQQSDQVARWVGLLVILVGGLLGLWLVRKARDEALILITMLVGVQLIQDALGLSRTSSWTAIFMTALALAGVLVQYATYLRELKAGKAEPQPQASSIAYFQDLELDR